MVSARPDIHSRVFMAFSTLGLSDALLRAVADQGYSLPTPIQARAIPAVLAGSDVLAGAQTGTGKTAGFVLPILQRLSAGPRFIAGAPRRAVRALILVPTRELAAQVESSVKTYGRHLPLVSAVVIGGASFHRQSSVLRRGVDILVATPGRLLDHHTQRNVDLSRVETFVLDEADRMLDMGFIRDIRRVIAMLPAKRQNLLFSATFSGDIKELARSLLDRPVTIEIETNATVEVVDQVVHPVDQERKRALLSSLFGGIGWRQVLVFTRTKHGADRLTRDLNADGIDALAIHGDKNQSARTHALSEFKGGDLRVLVATDIAARGIDIDALPHVVNYDLPNVPQDYVHRIGRTGRAGAAGQAVSLVSTDERGYLRDIERLIRKSIRSQTIEGFEPSRRTSSHKATRHRSGEASRARRMPR
jgi:ATP-dependent RNA helicase RhlE